MRTQILTVAALVVLASTLPAQERTKLFAKPRDGAVCPPVCPPSSEALPPPPDSTIPPPSDLTRPPTTAFNEALASAGESGTQPSTSYMPGFFGDLLPSTILTTVFIPEQNRGTFINSVDASQATPLKLAESDSPRPTNRFYYLYNFYGNIQVNAIDVTAPSMDVHRHTIGFEKTFLDGDASIGMRLPFFSMGGQSIAYDTGWVGDLVIITKYALINNRQTGNVFSTGLLLTAPTGGSPSLLIGPGVRAEQPRYQPVNLVPYFGYIYNFLPRVYVQGFHGVTVPTDGALPTFMSNGVGLGAFLFRDPGAQFVTALVPTIEVHVNTPFNHRTTTGAVGDELMLDSVNLTMGAHVVLQHSVFGGAVGVPLAWGPQRIEALATYTFRW
jgi:hypothetical protein